jgi:hypothetical protein
MSLETLLTVKDVATILGVSRAYVAQHTNGHSQPTIPSIWLGRLRRYRVGDVDRYIEVCRAATPTAVK